MARSAMVEAAAQLTQALGILAGVPAGPDRDQKELDLQIALGAALIATKGWAATEVEKAYARARELCTEESQFPQLLAALSGLFQHHLHWSSKLVALEIAGELLHLAERRQDVAAQGVGHRCLAAGLLFNGQLLPAMMHCERALALYDPAHRASPVYLSGPDTRVASLLFMSLILLLQGYPDRALTRSREALAAAHEIGPCFFHKPGFVPDLLAPSDPRRTGSRSGTGEGANNVDRGTRPFGLVVTWDDISWLGIGRRRRD